MTVGSTAVVGIPWAAVATGPAGVSAAPAGLLVADTYRLAVANRRTNRDGSFCVVSQKKRVGVHVCEKRELCSVGEFVEKGEINATVEKGRSIQKENKKKEESVRLQRPQNPPTTTTATRRKCEYATFNHKSGR